MANRFLSDAVGTLRSFFKISTVRLKDSSSVLHVRNAGDTAFINAGVHSLEVYKDNASNHVTITVPSSLAGNYSLVLPPDDGATGQVLRTDGSGVTTWVDVVSNADLVQIQAFTQATSSPTTIFTPPANARITKVSANITVAAGGGTPTISVGISGDEDRDLDELEVDLKTVGVYEVAPLTDVTGTPGAVILTITPDSQSFTGEIFVHYTNPA